MSQFMLGRQPIFDAELDVRGLWAGLSGPGRHERPART